MRFWTIPLLTKAPDSQSHKLEKFSGPQGAYGENPEWERSSRKYDSLLVLRVSFALVKIFAMYMIKFALYN